MVVVTTSTKKSTKSATNDKLSSSLTLKQGTVKQIQQAFRAYQVARNEFINSLTVGVRLGLYSLLIQGPVMSVSPTEGCYFCPWWVCHACQIHLGLLKIGG